MRIKNAKSDKEKSELDQLLWSILWEPLGLPRDIRNSFRLNGSDIELIAVDDGTVIGGLVANWISSNEIEIRHIAVNSEHQGNSIGKCLVEGLIKRNNPTKIQTHARSASMRFFAKLGFKPTGEKLEHPDFAAHGVSIHKMVLEIE